VILKIKKLLYLSKIAEEIKGDLIGQDIPIEKISQIKNGIKGSLSFIDNSNYLKDYKNTENPIHVNLFIFILAF